MTPWQLAKSGSEHGEQTALFCYCAKAEKIGFDLAMIPGAYGLESNRFMEAKPVPELAFYHAIPNGGNRGDNAKSRAIEGGRMKAEGVKPGVLDTFWPLVVWSKGSESEESRIIRSGLYIEMKKLSVKHKTNIVAGCSDEQLKFGEYATGQGYCARVCYTWLEAAEVLKWYYNLEK